EGRLPETVHGRSEAWRPAAAARNRCPGRPGTPSAGHYDPAASSSLHGSGGNAGDGSTGPGPKSPRWSAERRASPAGDARRLASAWRAASRARRGTASWYPASLGAPPPLGVAKGKLQTPGANSVAGTRKHANGEWRVANRGRGV